MNPPGSTWDIHNAGFPDGAIIEQLEEDHHR